MKRPTLALATLLFTWGSVVIPGRAASPTLTAVARPAVPAPGPAILHAPLASAPQLENGRGWTAAALMVSGADAYARGEYLYQDYVYDSFGANTTDGPLPPDPVPAASDSTFGGPTGDVVYPTDAKTYAFDAADLLEFRARPVAGGIAYRITLNTMLARDVAGVAIGIDADRNASTGTNEWGYGIGSLGDLGLEHVLVSWGPGAEVDHHTVPSTVDVRRNQIEFVAPLAAGRATWRHYVAIGLFDKAAKNFKAIGDEPSDTMPGGAHSTDAPPVFNIAFRFDEPMGSVGETGSRSAGYGSFREHAQATALAARDIAAFHADVSFAKLRDRVSESHVPTSGSMDRLYASHLDLGEGAQGTRPMLLGKIQPYAAYVPTTYRPGHAAPLHLLMHSLAACYNQYATFAPNILQQLGEERGAFVITPAGRGPDGWYHHEAEVDVFEAWADLASRYAIDARRVTVGGYSMGGYGTYKMGAQYPDLFAKAFAIVGPADENITGGPTGGRVDDEQNTMDILENLRNLPLLMWNGGVDELVPVAGVLQFEQRLVDLGYRHELDLFPTSDHFLLSVVDEWAPGKTFLGDATIDPSPSHVTYRAVPAMDVPALGLVHDHAFWISNVRVAEGAPSGIVDARSLIRGEGAPVVHGLTGAGTDPLPHVKRGVTWEPTVTAKRNAIEVTAEGVSGVTVWVERAGVDAAKPFELSVTSPTPVSVVLAGSFGARALAAAAGTTTTTVRIAPSVQPRVVPRTSADRLPATGVASEPWGILFLGAAIVLELSRRAIRAFR